MSSIFLMTRPWGTRAARKRAKGIAGVAAAVIVGGGIAISPVGVGFPDGGGGGGGGFGVTDANIWVDTNGGTCTDSASLVVYTDAGSCSSIVTAVAAADPGDVVGIKGGTYTGGNVIPSNASLRGLSPACDPKGSWGSASTANCVKLAPRTDEVVTMNGKIENYASNLWFNGAVTNAVTNPNNYEGRTFNWEVDSYVDTEPTSGSNTPDYVTFEGINALQIGAFNSTHTAFYDMDAGPATKGAGCAVEESSDGGSLAGNNTARTGGITVDPSDILFQGVLFHGATRSSAGAASDCHTGGFFFKAGVGVIFRKNVWHLNSVYNVQLQVVGSGNIASVTFENNWFGCPVDWVYISSGCIGQSDIQFNAAMTFDDFLIRYNSFQNGASCSGIACSFTNTRFVGNVGSRPNSDVCAKTGTTWGYNVWDAGNCGGTGETNDSLANLFVSLTSGNQDLHLGSGTVANNMVTPTSSDYTLTTDIDGASRTAGSRDAGSDER